LIYDLTVIPLNQNDSISLCGSVGDSKCLTGEYHLATNQFGLKELQAETAVEQLREKAKNGPLHP
jgi:hypothetical protein